MPLQNLEKLIISIKGPIDPKLHKGVYQSPCQSGKSYIGEIGRSIQTRVKEQIKDIRLDREHK